MQRQQELYSRLYNLNDALNQATWKYFILKRLEVQNYPLIKAL